MNLDRLRVIANNVFAETIRDRILYVLGLFAIVVVFMIPLIREVASTVEDKILLDVGLGLMEILGVAITVFISTGLINKEIDQRTIYLLIAKPLNTSELIVGKFLGVTAVLTVLVVGMMGIYLGILSLNQTTYPSLTALIISALFLILKLSLITAAAILLGVFTRSLVALFLTFGIYFMGNLSADMVKLNALVENPMFSRLSQVLFIIVPDLSRLDVKNLAVYGMNSLPDALTLTINAGYGIVYTMALLALATIILAQREF
ncbi:ABC transporter permease [Roseofilum capinflatum]|uniref:ABC transporter permease subunit n=1 Tax=Roseofilum capinflatum BLCC-M114 TaxID=3022440 RepID=A0ABT7B0J4_9CYAN|nr:ABC transporter permease subunit [Roseofilum capinflatum]MDJ1172681.1 ABC transporter permease subunit [Roseofilum capinflatum BLCC-M114]